MVLVVSPAFLEQNGALFIVEIPERNVFRGRRQPFSQCILDVHAGQVCITEIDCRYVVLLPGLEIRI